MMGEKSTARQTMKKAKVPILPGSDGVIESEGEALEWAKSVGYPVILKAVAGGGGRGMRICRNAEELPAIVQAGVDGSGECVRQRRPVHGEVHRAAEAHRVSGAGR